MNQQREVMRGNVPVGGSKALRPNRRFEILAKDFTSVEQAVPLRLVYGKTKPFAAVQVTPIFGFRSQAVHPESSGKGGGKGSKDIITGYNYWGGYAAALGLGPLYRLHEITNGDTTIWTGPADRSGADGDGKTVLTTSLGTIHFYWGTSGQNASAILEALQIDLGSGLTTLPTAAWRNVAYVVCSDLAFGQQTIAPTLIFHVERRLELLDLSTHEIDRDAVVPEVIYDLLTNTLYGAGTAEDVDVASFEAAAERTIDEELGCSPQYDERSTVREMVGQLLAYVDGFLYREDGKIKMGLTRQASTGGLATLDAADLLEEPVPNPSHFAGTWNKTIVTFNDRDDKWEETSEDYDDPANAAIVGESVPRTFHFPHVTNRATAQRLAKLIGIRGGLPTIFWDLVLKPAHRTLQPGDRFKLDYAVFGVSSRVVRVKRVEIGGPTSPEVKVTVQEEQTRIEDNDYVPPEDIFSVPGTLDGSGSDGFEPVSTTPRIATLPSGLKGDETDGLVVACNRPDAFTVRGSVYWTWDPGVQVYRSIGTLRTFPAKGTIVCWHTVRTDHWSLRVEMDSAQDYEWLQSLAESATDVYAVVVGRSVKTVGSVNDEHQVESLWLAKVRGGRFELVSDTVIDIEVEGAQFGSDDLLLETAGDDGRFPGVHVYFGTLAEFFVYPTSTIAFEANAGNDVSDTGLVRYIKTPVGNHLNQEALADVTAVTFDRNDSSMCPNGTFSREWGAAAVTAYEIFNVEVGYKCTDEESADYDSIVDLNEAMGAVIDGTATAAQTLLVEHISSVIGAMIDDGHHYYNV